MGRTYKRNDTYRSNRPKSLREKRNNRPRGKYEQLDAYESNQYSKQNKPNRQQSEYDLNGDDIYG